MNGQKQTETRKNTKKSVKRSRYDKPLSLYPTPFEEAVEVLLHTPPIKTTNSKKKRKTRGPKREQTKREGGMADSH